MVHDVHVDFSQNWEIHGPWVGVQAKGQGKYGHVVTLFYLWENYLLHSHLHLRNSECMVMMSI